MQGGTPLIPAPWEAKGAGSGTQVFLLLHNKFGHNLGCTRPCLKKQNKPITDYRNE